MRRKIPISQQLYAYLYPKPTSQDPSSFTSHLARNLVPEVRVEVATFYGDLNSAEARYPGLNYCHPPHRMRLGRFPHHKNLFAAFDALGLTYGEIQDFCCWEGTKWARDRYERDEGVKVLDTTGDEIGPFVDRRKLKKEESRRRSITKKTDISVSVEDGDRISSRHTRRIEEQNEEMNDADSEREADSSGSEEHQQTPAAERPSSSVQAYTEEVILALRRQRNGPLPPHVEQYVKDQIERGVLDRSSVQMIVSANGSLGFPPLLDDPSSTAAPSNTTSRAAA